MKKYDSKYLKAAHKASTNHVYELENSKYCGCFYCKRLCSFNEITEWIGNGEDEEKTALCPFCGIDAVLGNKYPIQDPKFLEEMNNHWFG